MSDCAQEKQDVSLPQPGDEQEKVTEEKVKEIEGELVENPAILQRLLERPQFMAIVRKSSFSGPLPPPSMLREYNEIVDNGAERIMVRSEKEQAHRHSMEYMAMSGAIYKDKRGQWMAFTVTIIILAIATLFAWNGDTVFAGTLITVDLIGLASVFILGRNDRPNKNNQDEE
ncbi:DUF2335 domain-containing protein [Escherichia fergusonii]|uniref:DUF2335 domain-containing protein n=1 Tax=Escherichia fergusonii TaxID=564 RepID=UPI0015E5134A|nr:DUF2335 domain-containing protein [Escherichia fergusonii]EHJ4142253.1 DUF2335 domain-containing protein [Escherichia fergusonii]EHP6126690.1 DUF2335 domain-containing protein [Escherichia coli]MBA8579769.1 DUF2335 domain-containing protein [Escherichia fergusonii]QLM34128.1 DUF2335 domain-containing protein [Escherichia fergusonii]